MSTSRAEKVAIVTGAAHGIGRAICVELAREGARVWACDILATELEETVRAVLAQAAGRCQAAPVDVTDPAQVAALVTRVSDVESRIDILGIRVGGVVRRTVSVL